jgi:two-component system phosphate regulon sensor histidine kinase PhoR
MNKEVISWARDQKQQMEELKRLADFRKEFLGNVSHELKTPIFAAQGFVHTLLDNPEEEEEIRTKFLEKAAKSLDGLDNLVQDLLTVSQIETGAIKIDKKKINLRPLIEELFEQLEAKAKKRDAKLKLIAPVGMIQVKADEQRISQVILNLVVNVLSFNNSLILPVKSAMLIIYVEILLPI